ncbi:MAG: hypothetical protein JNK38_18405 [Acidobacteria bacterium]|nr:hypothetical protein [Acidobacteriota bacterium]
MGSFNPYLVDEIVAQSEPDERYFGLIAKSENPGSELHGYEITLSGKVVLPEMRLPKEQEANRAAAC